MVSELNRLVAEAKAHAEYVKSTLDQTRIALMEVTHAVR